MSGIVLPIDAVSGSPSFPAADHRVAQAALLTGRTDRPLGARSGLRPGSEPTVTVTSTTWTVTPCGGVVDPETALTVGPYLFAFKANQTGSITAADASNPRVDRLDIQVPDDPAGASPLTAVVVYTAGTAAASPSAPAAPARTTPLGTISVPKATTGSPSFTASWRRSVAAGGIMPVRSSTEYPATPYVGQVVDDATIGGLVRWNGSAWVQIVPGTWVAYTPTLTRGDTGALIAGSAAGQICRYSVIGKTVIATAVVVASAASSGGGVAIDLPLVARDRLLNCGTLGVFGTAAPAQTGIATMTADKARCVAGVYTGGFVDIASGQNVRISVSYELP